MKVVVIIDTWFPFIGGGQINAWEISKRLARKGNSIDIITRNNGIYKPLIVKNLKIVTLGKAVNPEDNYSRAVFLLNALLYIRKKDYDIIHLHAFLPGLLAPIIKTVFKKPAIFTVHGTRMFEQNAKNSLGLILEKIILTKIKYDFQISVTKAFLKIKNINNKIVYIPNGINLGVFNKVNVQKSNYPKILWVGRFDPVKRLEDLITAMKIINKARPTARLSLVGYGPEEKKLKDLRKKLGVKNIDFVGKKEGLDLIKEYKSSHLFVLCSSSEGLPITILEAIASSLPIVATNVGGIPEILNGNKMSILVNPGNPKELAEGIIRFLLKKDKLVNNESEIKKLPSWDTISQLTENIYKDTQSE